MTDSERHSNHDDKDDGTRSEILTDEVRGEVANPAVTPQDSHRSKKSKIVQLQDDIQRYLQESTEDDNRIDLPMMMDDAWIHHKID